MGRAGGAPSCRFGNMPPPAKWFLFVELRSPHLGCCLLGVAPRPLNLGPAALQSSTAARQQSRSTAQHHSTTAAQQHGSTAAQQHSTAAAQKHSSIAAQQHSATAPQYRGSRGAQQQKKTAQEAMLRFLNPEIPGEPSGGYRRFSSQLPFL